MCGKKLNISLFSKKLVLLNLGKKKKKTETKCYKFLPNIRNNVTKKKMRFLSNICLEMMNFGCVIWI